MPPPGKAGFHARAEVCPACRTAQYPFAIAVAARVQHSPGCMCKAFRTGTQPPGAPSRPSHKLFCLRCRLHLVDVYDNPFEEPEDEDEGNGQPIAARIVALLSQISQVGVEVWWGHPNSCGPSAAPKPDQCIMTLPAAGPPCLGWASLWTQKTMLWRSMTGKMTKFRRPERRCSCRRCPASARFARWACGTRRHRQTGASSAA